uniref:Uncharacterized protein n=1 Tax=Romanomermis culicivorax TaxID=13658 RepID=A0A915IV84_ROMCU
MTKSGSTCLQVQVRLWTMCSRMDGSSMANTGIICTTKNKKQRKSDVSVGVGNTCIKDDPWTTPAFPISSQATT